MSRPQRVSKLPKRYDSYDLSSFTHRSTQSSDIGNVPNGHAISTQDLEFSYITANETQFTTADPTLAVVFDGALSADAAGLAAAAAFDWTQSADVLAASYLTFEQLEAIMLPTNGFEVLPTNGFEVPHTTESFENPDSFDLADPIALAIVTYQNNVALPVADFQSGFRFPDENEYIFGPGFPDETRGFPTQEEFVEYVAIYCPVSSGNFLTNST